jgi:hypothetical protein
MKDRLMEEQSIEEQPVEIDAWQIGLSKMLPHQSDP